MRLLWLELWFVSFRFIAAHDPACARAALRHVTQTINSDWRTYAIRPIIVIGPIALTLAILSLGRDYFGIYRETYRVPILAALYPMALLGYAFVMRKTMKRRAWGYLRREGIGLCFSCGYNLTGATRNRCPECGSPIEQIEQ